MATAGNDADEQQKALRGERTIILASAVTVIAIIIAMVAVVVNSVRLDNGREEDRVERAVEACLQYNRDQTRNRVFAHDQIIAVSRILGEATEDELEALAPRLAEYDAFVTEQFPYRQCSPVCVDAYFNDAVADCGPALDEEGRSP